MLAKGLKAGLSLTCFSQWLARSAQAASPTDSDLSGGVPLIVSIHFAAKAGQTEALVQWLTQSLAGARSSVGCRFAQVYIQASPPQQIVLFKGWDSRQAQAHYLDWERNSGRLAKLLALVEEEPRVEYWELRSPGA